MKVAISTDNSRVSAHFGRCPFFTIAKIEKGSVVSREVVPNPGHHPGFLPKFLKEQGVDCIIAGGMGGRASELFAQESIKVITGIEGEVDSVLNQLAEGALEDSGNICKPGNGKGYGIPKTED